MTFPFILRTLPERIRLWWALSQRRRNRKPYSAASRRGHATRIDRQIERDPMLRGAR